MKNFGKFMTIIITMTISLIINGYVVSKLWAWFIVPTFSLDPLRLIEAVGIVFLINFLKQSSTKTIEDDEFCDELFKSIIGLVMYSSFALLGGWVASMFM